MTTDDKLHTDDLLTWSRELPSPLAVALVRLKPRIDERDFVGASRAGLDALNAALRWTSFVGIADVFQKLKEDHPFARRERLKALFPHVRRVLEPGRSPEHWLACIAAITEAYRDHRDLFVAPELIERLAARGGMFVRDPKALVGACALSTLDEMAWNVIEPLLAETYAHLASFTRLRLVQFNGLFERTEEGRHRCARHLALRGYRMEEEDLAGGPLEIEGAAPPRLRELHIFDPDRSRAVCLHPFLLFSVGDEKGGSFFFNEVRQGALSFESLAGQPDLELTTLAASDDETGALEGPIFQYFAELAVLTEAADASALRVMPGFARRSSVLSFQRTIDFHNEAFSGRTEYFERIDHAIAGPFRCVWITGTAGYGKSALIARLARQHPGSIVYFVTPERGAANASRFLAHMCQSVIDRFGLSEVLPEEAIGNVSALKTAFAGILARASEKVKEGKLVLLVDGIDESSRYASRPEESIEACLPKSRDEIPERVVLIVTSRPEEVNLSHLADLKLELLPFSREQIATILTRHGWTEREALVAYEKSNGQPLYFRFLLDAVKRGELKGEDAAGLPEGIAAFYERFWAGCDERGERLQQHLLGFLAAAREPLTQADLVELVSGLDKTLRAEHVRKAFAKDQVGRFVIGSRRYSLIHDTLRAFVAHKTRSDDRPFGEARAYHEWIAAWCRQVPGSEYADQYLAYHLLHARLPHELLAAMEDTSPNGTFKRRTKERGGSAKLARDLAYATDAARELDSLDRIFCFTLLQISMNKLKKTAAVADAIPVLSALGLREDLGRLIESRDQDEERWSTTAAVFAHDLSRGDGRAADAWLPQLEKIWFATQSYQKPQLLQTLLQKLPAPTEAQVRRILEVFADIDKTCLPRVLCAGLPRSRELAARFVLEQDTRKASGWAAANPLVELAYDLVVLGDADLGWEMFALVEVSELDQGIPYVRALLARDADRALAILSKAHLQITEWYQVSRAVAILRAIHAVAGERVVGFLEGQKIELQVLGLCLLAGSDGAAYDRAVQRFSAECGVLSPINVFACLTLLALADGSTETRLWDHALGELLALVESAATNVEVNTTEIEQQLRALLPEATATMREVAHIFPEGRGALWFGLAVAGGALGTLVDPKLREWVTERLAKAAAESGMEPARRVVTAATTKLGPFMQYRRGRQALHGISMPVVTSLAARESFAARLRAMSPIAQANESELSTLNPRFFLSRENLAPLFPSLVNESGYALGLDSVEARALYHVALSDPAEGYALWKDTRGIKSDAIVAERRRLGLDEGASSDDSPAPAVGEFFTEDLVDGEALATVLLTSGRTEEGFEVLKVGKGGASGWSLFAKHGRERFDAFLAEVPTFMNTKTWPTDAFKAALGVVLDAQPAGEECDNRVRALLADEGMNIHARLEVGRWAFRHGLSDAGESFVTALAASDPATLKSELVPLVVPWIESRLATMPDIAGRMWELLTGFLASKSLDFLGELQASFDRKISVLMSEPEVSSRGIEDVAALLGPGFEQSRQMIAVAVVKAGWNPTVVAEWVNLDSLETISSLLQKLGSTQVPEWLVTKVFEAHTRFVAALELNGPNTWYVFDQVGFTGWSEEQRASVLDGIRARLESPEAEQQADGVKVYLAEWRVLLRGLTTGHYAEVGVAAAEEGSGLAEKIGWLAGINPRLSWAILQEVANPDLRSGRVAATFECGVSRDLGWALQTFRQFLTGETAYRMALSAMAKTSPADWPAIEPFVREAIERLPAQSVEHYAAAELLRAARDIETLLVPLLGKLRDPLGWVEYFCQPDPYGYTGRAAPTEALLVSAMIAEGTRWAEQIREMGGEAGIDVWAITNKVTLLLKRLRRISDPAKRSAILEPFLEAIEHIVEVRKADRENLLNQILKEMARLDPERTIDWIHRFEYRAYSLKDILGAVVAEEPLRIDRITQDLLRGLDEWTRKSTLVCVVSQLPLDVALEWGAREKLDAYELAIACAKSRSVDGAGMRRLEEHIGQDVDKLFALHVWALKTGARAQDALLESAYDVYGRGRFVVDQYDQVVFRWPDDPKLFASYDQALYSSLFALLPDRMDESFSLQVRQAKPEIQSKLRSRFDEIRAEAVPLLFETNPAWILPRRREWSMRSWWPHLSDELFAIIAALPAEDALEALAVFPSPERKHFEAVLGAVTDARVMHECLEVLITEVLVRDSSRIDLVMDLVMANLPKAGFDTLSAMANWARQFVKAKILLGVQASEVTELLPLLRGDRPAEELVTVEISDADRRHLAEIDTTIRMLRQHGQDATVFENLRKRLVGEGA